MAKIPMVLVTGFLGSGKTSLLKSLLAQYADRKRILLIQNEFADSGVDGRELAGGGWNFSLLELNKGSVFCVCLFADFKRVMVDQVRATRPELVVIETTGAADPIAIGQLLNDPQVAEHLYLSYLWNVVDVSTLAKLGHIRSVVNQIRVADTVVVNKCDLADQPQIDQADRYIKQHNPFARVVHCSYCQIDCRSELDALFRLQPVAVRQQLTGPLTRCDERSFVSTVFKSTTPIDEQRFEALKDRLSELVRLKGFVLLQDGRRLMLQYASEQLHITPIEHDLLTSELIAIGESAFDFRLT